MRVNLVLNPANRSWIIQKIAEELAQHLVPYEVRASLTESPEHDADLVHHMSWAFANVATPQPSTMFITHLDDLYKLNEVRSALASKVDIGICMSSDTMQQLERHGVPNSSLYFISPAHDATAPGRRIVIGITSRVYPDGRKREVLLHGLAQRMRLDLFEFQIFGAGWESTAAQLETAGALVRHARESEDYRHDYEAIRKALPHFDYYLYLGMDEGSLGTLDALYAGVPTIVTPQGFHLDLPGGITHAVVTLDDLERVFRQIAAQREQRVASVRDLSWSAYAAKHARLWKALHAGAPLPTLQRTTPMVDAAAQDAREMLRQRSVWINAMQPRRMLSALSHLPVLAHARKLINRQRFK